MDYVKRGAGEQTWEKHRSRTTPHDELMADDPTVELEMLEQTISIEGARELRHDAHGLVSAPIPRAWIREGNPVARDKRLAGSSDRLPRTIMWDCTAGRFDWFTNDEEVAHVLEGCVLIEDAAGARPTTAGRRYVSVSRGLAISVDGAELHSQDRLLIFAAVAAKCGSSTESSSRLTAPFRRKPAWATARDG